MVERGLALRRDALKPYAGGLTFVVAHSELAARAVSQDRVLVSYSGDALVLVVADGAGGTSRGRDAASALIEAVAHEIAHAAFDPSTLLDLLTAFDSRLAREGGETTALIAVVERAGVSGASVGDSEAWIVRDTEIVDLTAAQARKPLLGSGRAMPRAFVHEGSLDGTLLLASDGLFGYASAESIRAAATGDIERAACATIDLVRLPSGAPSDDVSVLLARM